MTTSFPVGAILQNKGRNIWSIDPEKTVFEAIKLMAHKNIGALLVMSGEKLVGVLSERDYTRKIALRGKSSKDTLVKEIISTPVISVTPNHSIEDCMRLMTEHRIRHLPVLDGEKLVGVVSIGDLVNWIISTQNATIRQMEEYISGGYLG